MSDDLARAKRQQSFANGVGFVIALSVAFWTAVAFIVWRIFA